MLGCVFSPFPHVSEPKQQSVEWFLETVHLCSAFSSSTQMDIPVHALLFEFRCIYTVGIGSHMPLYGCPTVYFMILY